MLLYWRTAAVGGSFCRHSGLEPALCAVSGSLPFPASLFPTLSPCSAGRCRGRAAPLAAVQRHVAARWLCSQQLGPWRLGSLRPPACHLCACVHAILLLCCVFFWLFGRHVVTWAGGA